MGRVAVAVTRYWILKPKLLVDQRDVFFFSGKKQPAWAGVIRIGIFLHGCWSVALGINADGIKKDIFAHAVTEHLLHLGQARGFQRTNVNAVGIKLFNGHGLALEQDRHKNAACGQIGQ